MRNSVACVSCRTAKRQCIHKDGLPPCDRCRSTGRGDSCRFPPPGTSSIHRQPKQVRRASTQQNAAAASSPGWPPAPLSRSNHHPESTVSPKSQDESVVSSGRSPDHVAAALDLSTVDPFELLTDEVKNSYLRCAYKWSFHHIPTLLLRVREKSLEPWVVWAMLALSIRFSNTPPSPFSSQIQASNTYAAHARSILQPDLENPTLGRIQALLMIVGHSWGAGEGRRAWIYLGMAVRMVQVMGLCDEMPYARDRAMSREEFIQAEERRRVAWTAFLMDSLLSGGKGRKRSFSADEMRIQLPCEKDKFVWGEPVRSERLDGRLVDNPYIPIGDLGIVAHSMRVADLWGTVARWACSNDEALPWSQDSHLHRLSSALERWKRDLPPRLQHSLYSLHAHTATEQGQAFCYMHAIYFMSMMFLHRQYLPVLGPDKVKRPSDASHGSQYEIDWAQWRKYSRHELFRNASEVCEMLDEMRTFGVFFLRGLVPWIGFTIYTAVGVMLYCYNFPSEEDDPNIVRKSRDRVINGCTFLKDMNTQWPMANTWFETIKRMQAFYHNMQRRGDPSPVERRALHNAMVDYGALQPSPVQHPQSDESSDTEMATDADVSYKKAVKAQAQQHLPHSRTQPIAAIQPPPHSVPPTSAQTQINHLPTPSSEGSNIQDTYMSGNPANQTYSRYLPASDPVNGVFEFDSDFDFGLNNSDLEALIADATQGFWAAFPGEVGFN